MHICLLSHSNCPWTPKYARIFREHGHRVSVISFHPDVIDDVEFHFVGNRQSGVRLAKWLYLYRVRRVGKLIARLQPDVVFATYLRSNGLIGSLVKQTPLVVSSRGVDQDFPIPFFSAALTRWVCSRAELVHTSSQELAELLVETGVPAEKITVIPLGTDVELFSPRPEARRPGPPRIICTRKHRPVYDNETLVRALGCLRDAGFAFECRFLGQDELTEKLRGMVAEHGLKEHVEFAGVRPHEELPEHLRDADIYVSASLADGTSSSLLEAMSCGLYPVVTDIPANRPWVTHERTGYLFAPRDHEACARGIQFAWNDEQHRIAAAEENRQLVLERGNLYRNTAELERVLIAVAGRDARTAR